MAAEDEELLPSRPSFFRPSTLHQGLLFGRLLRLGFVAVPLVLFGVLVAMLVISRRSHGHWRPNSPGELLLRAEVVPRRPMAPPAKLHWRRYPDHCLGIS